MLNLAGGLLFSAEGGWLLACCSPCVKDIFISDGGRGKI